MTAQPDVQLLNARLIGGEVKDLHVTNGIVTDVTDSGNDPVARTVHDLQGHLLLPAPADPHAHLDKALTFDRVPNRDGDLLGAIRAFSSYAGSVTHADMVDRATEAAHIQLAHGTTAIRSHANIAQGIGVRAVEALAQVRENLRGTVDVQIVALTGGGTPLTGRAGAENRAIFRAAMEAGADIAGGCPHLDPDPTECLDVCLQIAGEYGAPVDLHTDETLDTDMLGLEELADQVLRSGFPHPVAASHCVSLGMQRPDTAQRVAEKVSRAGISVITLPQTNLYLQSREMPTAKPRGLTAINPLRDAGVIVSAGGDNLRDPFNPLGRGDQLETAALLVAAGHTQIAEALTMVTTAARTTMGLPRSGVNIGDTADLLAISATTPAEAVAGASAARRVFRRGVLVCETRMQTRRSGALNALNALNALTP